MCACVANGVVTCKQQCRPTFTSWTWCRPTSVHKSKVVFRLQQFIAISVAYITLN